MNMMAPTRPAELHACRVQLTTGPAAAAEARSRAPSRARDAAADVDVDVAVPFTSGPGWMS
jgi:hypothetical protein